MINEGLTVVSIREVLKDLSLYLGSNLITYERYHVPFQELEVREDIRYARISFYEQSDAITDRINDYRANLSLVSFAFDISVIRAYRNDNDSRGEAPSLNIRDAIIDWSKQVNAQTLTGNHLLAFGYSSSANIIRNNKFVNRTITFDAVKDLSVAQSS